MRLRPLDLATDVAFARLARDYLRELDAAASERADPDRHLAAWAEDPDLEAWWVDDHSPGAPVGTGAGFLLVRVLPDWPDERRLVAELAECYIRPAARRRGLGRAAVEALLPDLRARGVRAVEASVLAGNGPAHAFWAALGFTPRSVTTVRRI